MAAILRRFRVLGWRRRYNLYGRPDFAFPKARLAVFVDGCFWHGCPKCYRQPKTNVDYWLSKIAKNRKRDAAVKRELKAKGWMVARFWECDLKQAEGVAKRLLKLLN
jgi:DNA mismatch endonuclease (patch repair protein)